MDYGLDAGFSGGNVVQVITGIPRNGVENWVSGSIDQAVCVTEDDYGVWSRETSVETTSNSNYDGRQSQTRSGSEPPNKKSRNAQSGDFPSGNRSRVTEKMFFKTKLCCQFQAGTCPYITNCNFVHSIEELRRLPPNWQEIVAAHGEEPAASSEPKEEFQIPSLGSSGFGVETQRSHKGRHCKKFFTDEGCPYGDNCTFLHDEQSKTRESVAISLGPRAGGGYGGNGSASNLKPSNWKTRICNKWELTGYCPFGSKCHFAHGVAELHRHGGGLVDTESKDSYGPLDQKQGTVPSKASADTLVASVTSVPHSDGYNFGVPSQSLSNAIQRTGQRRHQKWKGPDKISRIYGDWIDDIE